MKKVRLLSWVVSALLLPMTFSFAFAASPEGSTASPDRSANAVSHRGSPDLARQAEQATAAPATPVREIAPATRAEEVTTFKDIHSSEYKMDQKAVREALRKSGVNPVTAKFAARKLEQLRKDPNKLKMPKALEGSKSQLVAFLLCLFLGSLGIHRFYLGYTGVGILMLLTGGLCGILTLIDFIRIIIGDLGPKNGSYDQTW